jgi:predicted Zn-dependent protease
MSYPAPTRRLAIAALLLASSLAGCVVNPASGVPELSLMSKEDERRLGEAEDKKVVQQFGLYGDTTVTGYVQELGRALAANSEEAGIQWQFKVLDSATINAFALPGGFVYVTRGLLAHLQNQAQLAMVMGHEIGHVTARHGARQYTGQQLANLGLGLGALVLTDIRPYLNLAQSGLELLFLKYSRDDERQADELGVKYATRTGFQAAEGAKVFQTFKRLRSQEGDPMPDWLSSHPDPAERAETIPALATTFQAQFPGRDLGGTDPAPYLRTLDGMVVGADPRQGYVEGGRFIHPELQFQFPVPGDWRVSNFPDSVQLGPRSGGTMGMILNVSQQATPQAAATAFARQNGAEVLTSEGVQVNGMPALLVTSRIAATDAQGNKGALQVLSAFIAKDGKVYVFHGLSPAAAAAPVFRQIIAGFDQVRDAALLNRQPNRLQVTPAARTDRFDALAQPVAGLGVEDLAIMNQREGGETVTAGTPLKLVR